jgi:hypothetical protein
MRSIKKSIMQTSKTSLSKKLLNTGLKNIWLSCVLFFTGCAVSLAPKFDQTIVDNLSSTSTEAFQLLAGVSNGASSTDFSKREDQYNSIIGKLEALELQINARPLPHNKAVDKIIEKANERLKERNVGTLITVGDMAPSATAIGEIVKNINQMKVSDKAGSLTATTVQVFKGFVVLYFDQALTYERFLNN